MTIPDGYELLDGQKRILNRDTSDRQAHFGVSVTGSYDLTRLKQALGRLVSEHEILRTVYRSDASGAVFQVVAEQAAEWLPSADFCGQSDAALWAYLEREVPLNFERGPVLLVRPVVLSVNRLLLWFSMPLVGADAGMADSFTRQLAAAYERDQVLADDDLPFQFIDYCDWRAELLAEETEKEKQYWPARASRGERAEASEASAFGFFGFTCNEPLESGLQSRNLLLGAWQLLRDRTMSGNQRTCGVYFDGREQAALADLFGAVGRYLPVETSIRADQTVDGFLLEMADRLRQAGNHQDLFFPELLEPNQIPGIGFEYHQQERSARTGGVLFEAWDQKIFTESFELQLICRHGASDLKLGIRYATAQYDAAEIACYAERLVTLISAMNKQPHATIAALEMIGVQERGKLLALATGATLPINPACIHDMFEARAQLIPQQRALFFEDAFMSYGELNERANRLAHYLRGRGIGLETPVAICMRRGFEMVVGILAVMKAGGFYVPLDPKDPMRRLIDILEDAAVGFLLTKSDANPFNAGDGPVGVEVCCVETLDLASHDDGNPMNLCFPENLAYTIYTSGTTGKPKGVQMSHSGPINLLAGLKQLVYGELNNRPLRVGLNAPLNFDASVQQLLMLLEGHCIYIIPEEIRMDGAAIAAYLDRHEMEVLDCTPAHLKVMIEAGLFDGHHRAPLKVLCAGGAFNQVLWDAAAGFPATECYNIYGPTECTVDASGCLVETPGLTPSIGPPLTNYQIFLLDETFRLTPFTASGEVCIGGDGLARGYLARPELTAQQFVPHPHAGSPGQRLYRTGDKASYAAEGRMLFIGRLDDQLKLRGYRIEPAEIEERLLEHAAVQQAHVMARTLAGHGDEKRLVAYVCTLENGGAALEDDLRDFLAQRLPQYMVPPHYVILEKMPLTPSGKIDRAALPEPTPVQDKREDEGKTTSANAVADLLAGLWRDLLGVERVGPEDDFFELGGHSLLTIQLVGRIRHVFQANVDLLGFFQARDIQGQAALIEESMRKGAGIEVPPMVKVNHNIPQPASYSQQRLWFVYQVDQAYDAYHIPAIFKLTGTLDIPALEKTLAEIVKRQKSLRTIFSIDNGQVMQEIVPFEGYSLPIHDLRGMSLAEGEALFKVLAEREVRTRFDLERDALFRVQVLLLADGEFAVMSHMHHIVSDGWSVGVLVQELVALYTAFSRGRPSPLPVLPVQYVDYAVWQREWLQGAVFDSEVDYWRTQLEGAPSLLNLPHDHQRPENATEAADFITLTFSNELSGGLNELCQEQGVTLFMALLAGFNAAMSYFTGDRDIVVGTDAANRGRFETEKLIGFFINQLPMRVDLTKCGSLKDLLEQTRTNSLGAFLHQDMPFDRLVEALQPERSPHAHPLFQVKFVLQNAPTHLLELPGIQLTPLEGETGATKLDLQLNMWEQDETIMGILVFKREVFEKSTMATFQRHFENTLQLLIAEPETSLDVLHSHLAERERLFQKERAEALKKSRFSKFQKLTRKNN